MEKALAGSDMTSHHISEATATDSNMRSYPVAVRSQNDEAMNPNTRAHTMTDDMVTRDVPGPYSVTHSGRNVPETALKEAQRQSFKM